MNWEDIIAEEVKRKRKVFEKLDDHLSKILDTIRAHDEDAEVYLFGSVLKSKHLLSSGIDVLTVTDLPPEKILAILWEAGLEDPFEFHIIPKNRAKHFIQKIGKVKKIK